MNERMLKPLGGPSLRWLQRRTLRPATSSMSTGSVWRHAPTVKGVEVVRRGRVRRAKLYYLRGRRGKSARIAEKRNRLTELFMADQQRLDILRMERERRDAELAASKPAATRRSAIGPLYRPRRRTSAPVRLGTGAHTLRPHDLMDGINALSTRQLDCLRQPWDPRQPSGQSSKALSRARFWLANSATVWPPLA